MGILIEFRNAILGASAVTIISISSTAGDPPEEFLFSPRGCLSKISQRLGYNTGELRSCVEGRNRKFFSVKISGGDFRGSLLDRASFASAEIENTMAESVVFNEARLVGSVWRRTDLQKSQMRGVWASRAQFLNCNLKSVDFRGAKLWRSKFDQSDLSKADFREAFLPYVSFRGADLRGANLTHAVLTVNDFREALFDASTKLPFGESEALAKGMIKK